MSSAKADPLAHPCRDVYTYVRRGGAHPRVVRKGTMFMRFLVEKI